ncbi:MAG: histidine phosphatase family protein [Ruminococcus sp.]|jgi:alpha-ribazole phosphatase
MKLYLIRHSITRGNTLGRYIGRTDEPLCQEGIKLLKDRKYPPAAKVYASPLCRCVMTAELIYPGQSVQLEADLAECDFGAFENKNYKELEGDSRYQQWIDSGGTMAFPQGESQEKFRSRCVRGFEKVVEDALNSRVSAAALIVHGGTIMAVLERFAVPHREFYDWQVKNGCGFEAAVDEERWRKGMKEVTVCGKLDNRAADGERAR